MSVKVIGASLNECINLGESRFLSLTERLPEWKLSCGKHSFKMLSEIFLPYVKFQIKVLKFLKAAPFVFDKVNNEITTSETKIERIFRQLVQILEWAYLCAMCTVVYRLKENGCPGKMMEAAMCFNCTLNLLLYSYGWDPNEKAVELLNALVKFDKNFGKWMIADYPKFLREIKGFSKLKYSSFS